MKEALKRAAAALGLTSAPAQAEVDETAVTMVTHSFEAPADAASYEEVQTSLAELTVAHQASEASLATALASVAGLQANLDAANSELTALKAANADAAATALAAKLDARKAAIVASMGTDRADAIMAATEGMADAQFETVLAAMAGKSTAESKSELFVEKGVDAQSDVDALQAEAATNGTAAILKAKYQQAAAK